MAELTRQPSPFVQLGDGRSDRYRGCQHGGLERIGLAETPKRRLLGHDADTTAAVCGQLAGAHYGIGGIPARWLNRLAGRSMIEQMAVALCR